MSRSKKQKPVIDLQFTAQEIVLRKVEDLRPFPNNPKIHSAAQISALAENIRSLGFDQPVLIDENDTILKGHGRCLAAPKAGRDMVPTIVRSGLSADDKWAIVISDNALPAMTGFDRKLLTVGLTQLAKVNYPLTLTGFDNVRLATFGVGPTTPPDAEEVPEPEVDAVSVDGDIWVMGNHRVLCGNSLDIEQVNRLLDGKKPDIANCDPPYGISVVKRSSIGGAKPFGRVHGPARNAIIKPGVYAPIVGDETTETAVKSYEILTQLNVPKIVLWGGNYFASSLPDSRCWLVWDKENTGSFADVELAWTNQDAVAKIFRHQWSGLIKASERGERRVHPTQKPIALETWVI